jgi:hypothetical protein
MSDQDSISWSELAELTHATQLERFNWCSCEEQEDFPYSDCPRNGWVSTPHLDISFQHCGRPAYWENEDVYCSKCQTKMKGA